MANVTITTAANFIPEIWSTLVLETLHKNLIVAPLVDRRYEKFARMGDTIHVPGLAEITASTLTNMTGSLTFSANTESVTNISINTLAYGAFKVDDVVRVQSALPEMEFYTREAGRSVAQKVDTDVLTEMDTTTNFSGTDNIDLTDDNVLEVRAGLDGNNVPMEDRSIAISQNTLTAFFKIEKYMSNLYNASVGNFDASKGRGFVGRIYEAGAYETTNLPAGSSGKVNFYFQKEGIALVMQKDINVENRTPHDEIAHAIIAWTVYGVKLMRAGSVYELRGK